MGSFHCNVCRKYRVLVFSYSLFDSNNFLKTKVFSQHCVLLAGGTDTELLPICVAQSFSLHSMRTEAAERRPRIAKGGL